jgi:integrase/recombinase XerD
MKQLEMFVDYMKNSGKSKHTIKLFPRYIKEFFEIMEVETISDFKALKIADYYKYLQELENNGNGNNTRNTKLSAINSFGEYCLRMEFIDKNVAKLVDRSKTPQRISIQPTKEQAKAILKAVRRRPKLVALYTLLMNSGIRIEECLSLRLSDFREGCLFILGGKGNKDRIVPLNDQCVSILQNYIDKHRIQWSRQDLTERHDGNKKLVSQGLQDADLIFLGKNGLRMYNSNLNASLTNTAKVCGLDKSVVHPHAFRHYFATEFVNQGGDVTELQKILGHNSLKTTQIYFETNVNKIKATMGRMSF